MRWSRLRPPFASLFLAMVGAVAALAQESASETSLVTAEMSKESAWVGESVPFYVVLRSPGPFSGAPSFDFPELPLTVFARVAGSPIVGSEQIGEVTYFTQRHRVIISTQQSGEIIIPPFLVRFEGKRDFLGDPEPMQGQTPELRFESRRPPGTGEGGLVVAATGMEIEQSWSPETEDSIEAGSVVERTITRRASGTMAMILPPMSTDAPDGVRVYSADPKVEDITDRGESRAERTDTVKYQFERAGTFELPELTLTWWDPQAEQLRSETLAGQSVSVHADPAAGAVTVLAEESAPTASGFPWSVVILAAAVALAGLALYRPTTRLLARWRSKRNQPTAVAARRVRSACRSGDAAAAYGALLAWKRALATDTRIRLDVAIADTRADDLQREWTLLSRSIYSHGATTEPWSGRPLARAFKQVRKMVTRRPGGGPESDLPLLNPIR